MLSEQEKLQYQKAHETYLEIQRRKNELPKKDKRLFAQLEQVEVGRYDVTYSVMCMIAEVYQNSALNAFNTILH